jgi:hypothetical protein
MSCVYQDLMESDRSDIFILRADEDSAQSDDMELGSINLGLVSEICSEVLIHDVLS